MVLRQNIDTLTLEPLRSKLLQAFVERPKDRRCCVEEIDTGKIEQHRVMLPDVSIKEIM